LKAAGADVLFRCFDTTADAVASFHRRAISFPSRASTQCANESAA
jgi:hypothetical protein